MGTSVLTLSSTLCDIWVSNSLLSKGKGTQIALLWLWSSWQFFISLLHAGYTKGLEAHCAACHATRWDKKQTNIWAAPSNLDQSVCQGPDKLRGRRGWRMVEGVGCDCGNVRLSTLEDVYLL